MSILKQIVTDKGAYATEHPSYVAAKDNWTKIRDCVAGESKIKSKRETYLPRPEGMSGQYAAAYTSYIERAHFPLISAYALQGALGVIITKLPEFNVPPQLEYLKEKATKDGRTLRQLFIDMMIEVLQSGRCPLTIDIVPASNEFRFVQYKAEDLINWKTAISSEEEEQNIILGVIKEAVPNTDDIFSHDTDDEYHVLYLDEDGNYAVTVFSDNGNLQPESKVKIPKLRGQTFNRIPLFVAGSINTRVDVQPAPLLSVANCSIQIYRKEADLANSEFLSCNPTLVLAGVSNDSNTPNVVGSSVMICLPDPAASAKYTKTDTAALQHVKNHIDSLYEEAIRHGVAILDSRKGVEAAEALRIRQATQSASIYSMYLSVMTAIQEGLQLMCEWGAYDKSKVILDAPSTLTQGVPDASVISEIVAGFGNNVVPLSVIHKYLIGSGLLDQTIGYQDYLKLLDQDYTRSMRMKESNTPVAEGDSTNDGSGGTKKTTKTKKTSNSTNNSVADEEEGSEDVK